jgi:hypothetical protein
MTIGMTAFEESEPVIAKAGYDAAGASAGRYLDAAEALLRAAADREAHEWSPGEACAALQDYLSGLDAFTASAESAAWARRRLRELGNALYASVDRDPDAAEIHPAFQGVYDSLVAHDELLKLRCNIDDEGCRNGRELAALEISYVLASPET